MPSQVVTAHTTAQEVVAERADAVVIPTSMLIDNKDGGDDRTIWIQDRFTPAAYYGNEDPDEVGDDPDSPLNRYRISVIQGDIVSLNEEDLKGVKCLGSLYIDASAIDGDCHITVGYKHE